MVWVRGKCPVGEISSGKCATLGGETIERAKYCDQLFLSVCLFVCLSAGVCQKPHVQIYTKCLVGLSVAVARSSSDDNATCNMYFQICGDVIFTLWSEWAKIKDDAYVSSSSPVGDTETNDVVCNLATAHRHCHLTTMN